MTTGLVCLMGIGIVFVGLICIVAICKVISFIVNGLTKGGKTEDASTQPIVSAPVADVAMSVDEKRAILAGVCAVIAEELGTDASNIRVRSFRRV